jgi:hypothetical protein
VRGFSCAMMRCAGAAPWNSFFFAARAYPAMQHSHAGPPGTAINHPGPPCRHVASLTAHPFHPPLAEPEWESDVSSRHSRAGGNQATRMVSESFCSLIRASSNR